MPGPYGPGRSGEGNEPVKYVVVTGLNPVTIALRLALAFAILLKVEVIQFAALAGAAGIMVWHRIASRRPA